jgi:hypothetical protein
VEKAIAIEFPLDGCRDNLSGGYGCRTKFLIKWDKEDLENIIDYSKYDYHSHVTSKFNENTYVRTMNVPIPNGESQKKECTIQRFNSLDGVENVEDLINKDYEDVFKEDITLFTCCTRDIYKYALENDLYKSKIKENYFDDLFFEWQQLYDKYLKLVPDLQEKANKMLENKPIVGLQLRCGDGYMNAEYFGDDRRIPSQTIDSDVKEMLKKIKNHIEEEMDQYYVFPSADWKNMGNVAREVFGDKVLYYDKIPMHIDRPANQADPNYDTLDKTFFDSYMLSKVDSLYYSTYSTFGQAAAMANKTEEVYDIFNLNKINKKKILY